MTLSYMRCGKKTNQNRVRKWGFPEPFGFHPFKSIRFLRGSGMGATERDQKSRRPIRLVITHRKKRMTGSRAPRYNSPMMTKKP